MVPIRADGVSEMAGRAFGGAVAADVAPVVEDVAAVVEDVAVAEDVAAAEEPR